MNRWVCVYFCRKCCPRQIWSCIFTRCYLPWTCQVPALRLLYTVGPPTQQVLSLPRQASWGCKKQDVLISKTWYIYFFCTHWWSVSFQYGFFMGSSSILTVAHTLRAATDCPPFSTLMVRSRLFVTLKPMHSFSQIFATLSLDVELHDEIWYWETIWQLLSDKSVCRAIKTDSLHKSDSPGSQLGVRHNRPAGKSSQFCLKDYVFIHILDSSVLTNMLFERPNYCCNHPHSAARVNANPVQVSLVG